VFRPLLYMHHLLVSNCELGDWDKEIYSVHKAVLCSQHNEHCLTYNGIVMLGRRNEARKLKQSRSEDNWIPVAFGQGK
jgi:hypothetical protein